MMILPTGADDASNANAGMDGRTYKSSALCVRVGRNIALQLGKERERRWQKSGKRAGGSQFPRVIDSQTGTDQSLSLVLRRRRQNNLFVCRVDSHWTDWVTRTQNLQVLVSLLQRTTLVCFAAKEWIRQLLKCVASPSAVMDFTCVTE